MTKSKESKTLKVSKETKRYEKKDPIEHILIRPDMYVGSIRLKKSKEFLSNEEMNLIEMKEISSSPAILRIFIEALSNAIDNVERSLNTKTKCTMIKININLESGETSIWNDGDIVPIEMNEKENCYNHTMIFGQLLTGSNYDDEEERLISGRNGLGIKLCNIFSTKFIVEGCDPVNRKHLIQEWERNMRDTQGPKVTKILASIKKGFTKVSWFPDFKLFGLESYTADIINLYKKYIIDSSMLSKVKVYFNDSLLEINNLQGYSKLYKSPTEEKLYIESENCKVLLTPSNGEFQAISFVNGVYTKLGGLHVEAWTEALLRPIVDKFNGIKTKLIKKESKNDESEDESEDENKKKKTKTKVVKKVVKKVQNSPKINITDVKQFFRLFVVATVNRPEFDGQDKNRLESPEVVAEVLPKHISAINKWSVIENIEQIIKAKEMVVLKKVETKKNVSIPGYDPANNCGGKKSTDCILIICEGLSAKTYAVAGIEKGVFGKEGRDWFGILPLTGKILNVRNAVPTSIAKNKVIVSLIQALGLKHNVDYTIDKNFETLRYGKVMFLTDADCDGIHIESLLINFFNFLFPSLLKRDENYLISMKTPIVRVGKSKLFYDERNFHTWLENKEGEKRAKNIEIKYYKGLGTSKAGDISDTFGSKIVQYSEDENSNKNIEKVFHKKMSNQRKEWLSNYDPNNYSFSLDKEGEITNMTISQFIDEEMIKFSITDCERSIPNMVDGSKTCQRKIMYAVFKKKLRFNGTSFKVKQLAGYTSENSGYHYGDQNLEGAITGMASIFVGSNNISLLFRDGMFGTRLEGGNDCSASRYIFTKMDLLTEFIYKEDDFHLLKQVNCDGDLVEPFFYVPIIPMILVNGCNAGIGTGWSCNVPSYNPVELIEMIKLWLNNEGYNGNAVSRDGNSFMSIFPEIKPWYRDFNGEIEKEESGRFVTYGIVTEGEKNCVHVTELPVGMWTSNFKEHCEKLLQEKKISELKNYSTADNVHFIIKQNDAMECNIQTLKLHTYISTSNMVLFNENGEIKKYETVDEIIDEFCKIRFEYYVKRRNYLISKLENEIRKLGNKEKFIKQVTGGELIIMNREKKDIVKDLIKNKYDMEDESFNYLFDIKIQNLTRENEILRDIEKLNEKLEKVKSKSAKEMWIDELDELLNEYPKWLNQLEKEKITKKSKTSKGKGKK